jgi:hypothetical protein
MADCDPDKENHDDSIDTEQEGESDDLQEILIFLKIQTFHGNTLRFGFELRTDCQRRFFVEAFGGWCGVAIRLLVHHLGDFHIPQFDHPETTPRGNGFAVRAENHP